MQFALFEFLAIVPKAIKGAPAIASNKEIPILESPEERLPVAKVYAENNKSENISIPPVILQSSPENELIFFALIYFLSKLETSS